MDTRVSDTRQKIAELEGLLAQGEPEALFDAAGRAMVALEFRASDAMLGLDEVSPDLLDRLADLALEAQFVAAEKGHLEAAHTVLHKAYFGRFVHLAERCFNLARQLEDDTRSRYYLGLYYLMGWGCTEDPDTSLACHARTAEEGDADAMFEVYAMTAQGIGTAADPRTAHQWLVRAAEAGSDRARCNLGGLYATGNGVPKDEALAIHWYDLAARNGYGKAAATLGVMYSVGEGAPLDPVRGREYFEMAGEAGFAWEPLAQHYGIEA